MCFGERTTFVCSMDGCINKHWETKWYAFGADPDGGKCDAGNVLGTCADPWMVYHQEEKMCTACYTRWTEELPPPSPTREIWHPQDHARSLPLLPTYEQFEKATIEAGELTGPMIVARELARQPFPDDTSLTSVFQQNVPEHQLLDQIRDIIRRSEADALGTDALVNEPNASNSTEATLDAHDDLPASPTTPVRALSRSEISAAVFEGPLPQISLEDTPLPAYDQAVSRGHAPFYSLDDPMDIPVNLRTLKRLSDYCYYLRKALPGDLQEHLVSIVDSAEMASTMPHHYSVAKMLKIADAGAYLEQAMANLCNKIVDRREIVFRYNTTSATENQIVEWIAEITRNTENSVRSHTRRFTEWVRLLDHELTFQVLPHDSPHNYKLPDGSRYPNCQAINHIFDEEEVRDRRTMQDVKRRDKEFPHFYRPNDYAGDEDRPQWHDGSGRGPVHTDTRRRIRIPTRFGVPDPRPLPGPNHPMEVTELDVDGPGDAMEID